MALLAERSGLQEELTRLERQRWVQEGLFPAFPSLGKQQIVPLEIRRIPTRAEVHLEQGIRTYLGGDLIGVQLSENSPKVPQPDRRPGTRITLGHLTSESGPAFELASVKQLLGQGRVVDALELLQRALSRYPTDARLLNLSRAVTPGAVVRRDVRYSDRTAEMAWIKANRANYRGKWVALLGEKVLGVGDSLTAVLCLMQEQRLEETPLIHHVD
jgi:hypothetical protein